MAPTPPDADRVSEGRDAPKDMPPQWVAWSIAAMLLVRWLAPGPQIVPWPWNTLGLVLMVGGFLVTALGAREFRRAETPVRPFERSTRLVTTGLHGWSRNPMYLGFVILLAGVATLLGRLVPWLVIPAFLLLLQRRFVRREERMMERLFPEEYRAYRTRVRRWL